MTESISNYGEAVKLSIITIHLNDFPGFERTLKSLGPVLGNAHVEWIVIDGGSNLAKDKTGSFMLVRSLAAHFISEPDDGIYDAMNKGTQLASGGYVVYLNSGDELHPDFQFNKLAGALDDGAAGMIWGRYDVRDHNETVYPPVSAGANQ